MNHSYQQPSLQLSAWFLALKNIKEPRASVGMGEHPTIGEFALRWLRQGQFG